METESESASFPLKQLSVSLAISAMIEFRSQTCECDVSHVFSECYMKAIFKILTNQKLISWQIQCYLD